MCYRGRREASQEALQRARPETVVAWVARLWKFSEKLAWTVEGTSRLNGRCEKRGVFDGSGPGVDGGGTWVAPAQVGAG